MLSTAVTGGGGQVVWAMLVVVQIVLVTVLTPVECASYHLNSTVCSFKPKQSPESVECDLSDPGVSNLRDSITIDANNIPSSVHRVSIVNADLVTVRQDALSALSTLENILFENISELTISRNTPVPEQRQGQVSVTLNNIKYLRMETDSFSHWKEKTLNISIANIDGDCVIYKAAIVSSSFRTKVVLENIAVGYFHPGTFATTLGELTLNNVTTTLPCQNNTFAGRIGKLSLTSVTIGLVEEACFLANQTWDSLDVRSSSLGDIRVRGLQGRIGDIRIEDSRLGQISPNGFYLNVSSLSINASSIDVLESRALNVYSSGWISILMSNVTTIHKNALLSLNSSGGIRLDQLSVTSVVNGSLNVSDIESLTLRELQFRIPCECNIQKQVSELFFGGRIPGTLTKRERAWLFQSAYRSIQCLHNDTTPLLREYHCTNCHPRLEPVCVIDSRSTGSIIDSRADERASASAILLWGLFGGFLLLGAVITLLVIRHRRRSAPRRRNPGPKRTPSIWLGGRFGRPPSQSVADIQHTLPDLLKDGQQMDSESQSPGGERRGEVALTVAARSTVNESVYATVPEATVGSTVSENVSDVASKDDQPLYEDISSLRQMRGEEEEGVRAEFTQASPLYAEVKKGKGKSATTSDDFGYVTDSSDPPVYAQVNKNRPRTTQRSGETLKGSRLASEESPLYACVMYSAGQSADSKENDDFSEGVHYNALSGVNMSPTG